MTPPGTSTHGSRRRPGQGHHHRRQPLVAGGHAEHAAGVAGSSARAGGRPTPRRCDRPGCRTCRACPACGRRRDRCNAAAYGTPPAAADLLGRRLHGQPDLPMSGVVAQGDRRAVVGANAAQGAEQDVLTAGDLRPGPSPCPHPATCRKRRRWAGREGSHRSAAACPAGPGPCMVTS